MTADRRRGLVLEILVDGDLAVGLTAAEIAAELRVDGLIGPAQEGRAVAPLLLDLLETGHVFHGAKVRNVRRWWPTQLGVHTVVQARQAAA